jgi:PAS domain S-box-containing protein
LGISEDITESKQAEAALRQSEERFSKVFLANPAGIALTDLDDGKFIDVNDSYLHMLGYSREEAIGHSAAELGILLAEERARIIQSLRDQGAVRNMEVTLNTRAGEKLDVLFSLEQIELQGRSAVLSIVYDITARNRGELALRQLNAELAAANRELEAFAYSVSHDLRAPLRAIDGFSLALQEDFREQLDAEGQENLSRVRLAAQRMAELIDDLLQLSRVTRSEMRREQVDLSAVARSIVAALQQAESARPAQVTIADGLGAEGDGRLLRVALENLLGNAWKFTGKRPHTQIEFNVMRQNGQAVYFVRDNGAGFDMAYAQSLFGAFQRLHTPREFPGTGIGLATVQRIIHRHGGRVWAEATVEHGATFYFTLPGGRN